jgi:hypothetical protein
MAGSDDTFLDELLPAVERLKPRIAEHAAEIDRERRFRDAQVAGQHVWMQPKRYADAGRRTLGVTE